LPSSAGVDGGRSARVEGARGASGMGDPLASNKGVEGDPGGRGSGETGTGCADDGIGVLDVGTGGVVGAAVVGSLVSGAGDVGRDGSGGCVVAAGGAGLVVTESSEMICGSPRTPIARAPLEEEACSHWESSRAWTAFAEAVAIATSSVAAAIVDRRVLLGSMVEEELTTTQGGKTNE
jgi:hypothetical protein